MAMTQRQHRPSVADLSFPGMVRSEWVKLRSVRSSWWCLGILLTFTVGIPLQTSAGLGFRGMDAEVTADAAQSLAVYAVSVSTDFGAMIVSVLGVLVVATEYGTGMIRTTFAASPRRVSVLMAKALVLAAAIAVVAVVGVAVAAPITWSPLRGNGVPVDAGDPQYWSALLRIVIYLVLTGVIAAFIAAIIRNTVGALSAALALALAAPLLVGILGGTSQTGWLRNIANLLPANAGAVFFGYPSAQSWVDLQPTASPPGVWEFGMVHGGLTLVAWVVLLVAIASVSIRRRDA